jgi:Glycosyltransferase family 87
MQDATPSVPDTTAIRLTQASESAEDGNRSASASLTGTFRRLFPARQLGKADYILSFAFIGVCFFAFFHDDIWGAGWDSLNYIFGHPLDFYENCKRIRGGGQIAQAPYPPTIYVIFAFWLYPLKLLGLITGPESFPHYLTYWLKALTTFAYLGTTVVFYRISIEYSNSRENATYAAAAWFTMPLALFSEFIFSQYDVFYVLLTVVGFLMFLRKRLMAASLCFGIAITFKYFPAFVYLPLLLFYEKRVQRIALYSLIFLLPTLAIDIAYGRSPAFIQAVLHHVAIDRVYAATIDSGFMGYWSIYTLPALLAVLCGVSYFLEPTDDTHKKTAAYIWLISSVLPFLLIIWHPQWVMFFAPPIVLTSILSKERGKFIALDIFGMLMFVPIVSLIFSDNVDAVMFQGPMFGIHFDNAYLMAQMFEWFDDRSLSVFYSGFCAYLVLQVVLKFRLLRGEDPAMTPDRIDYGGIRKNLYVGLLIFILPASFAICKDVTGHLHLVQNDDYDDVDNFGELSGERAFEQTFTSEGHTIEYVSLVLKTSTHAVGKNFLLEILDANNNLIARSRETVTASSQQLTRDIRLNSVAVETNAQYKIRLTAPSYTQESDITWLASTGDSYKRGQAVVSGTPKDSDFLFRVVFAR